MMRRLASFAVLAAALCLPADAAQPPVPPAAKAFMLGTTHFWALRDGATQVPNDGQLFPGAPTAEIAKLLRAGGVQGDGIPLSFDALLVTLPGHVVLLDTGHGPKMGGTLLKSLAMTGITPGDVTDIFITHSHFDHVGGLMTLDGRSAFPKAKIRMATKEWAFLKANPRAPELIAAIGAQVVPFEPGTSPVPGIATIALAGHTPGHSGYEIGTGKDALIDIGDSAHSSIVSLAHPEWSISYDTDDAAGKGSREAVLAKIAASGKLVFAPHFPFPGVGHVVTAGSGYRWVPATL